ncbi:MAG: bifunctional phosphoribosylaminoimidazolecarboxamide formyltransferase/IMP cyclohydrolase [Cardiobacteriaceae bacterium]|nr:bifunctional phosphoribosylaminoimidazolecarboxamide formyltransferase/IMP cyclohydrolase [Cardiobacteriaceae bacterium]
MKDTLEKITPRRALLSVSDKTGIVEFAKTLTAQNIEILSTGGTAKLLQEQGIKVQEVADFTGFPEIMGGRVKTLHPKIHGGLLGRRGEDEAVMQEQGILPIDLLVVNLYPFRETISRPDCTLELAIENIDIGGPAMLRSAAKNHIAVAVVVDNSDYPKIAAEIEKSGGIALSTRQRLAAKAFRHTANYDRAISQYLQEQYLSDEENPLFPVDLSLDFKRVETLRYGENPQQKAAIYRNIDNDSPSLATIRKHQGKELSFNNYADADTALMAVMRFSQAACVIVKHANPCGVAVGENVLEAYEKAYRCDPTSAFGGIIAFNRAVNADCAREIISRQFVEVIAAPDYSAEALQVLQNKPNIRVLELKLAADVEKVDLQIQSIHGGILLQERDNKSISHQESDFKTVSAREPTSDELKDLLFAWRVVQSVKSNAIVFAKDGATLGIGGGQTSRVFAARIAALKAQDENLDLTGSVLAGDAFFPFKDGVEVAAKNGVTAIIHPGGSIRDEEVINCANEHNIAMIFTGIRHFRH